jgi:hypothetical protein
LQGWWEGKVGIEKSPEYKLNIATPLFDFEPGRTYRIQGGSIDGHCFVFVDGKIVLEVTDSVPLIPIYILRSVLKHIAAIYKFEM